MRHADPGPGPQLDGGPGPIMSGMAQRISGTLVTFNMGGRTTDADVVELVRMAQARTPGRWAVACQETGDQRSSLRRVVDRLRRRRPGPRPDLRDRLARAADAADVQLVMGPAGLGRAKSATLCPRGHVVDAGLYKLTPRTFVGAAGAGGPYQDHKYVHWLQLDDGDGWRIALGNVHLTPSVQGGIATPWRRRRRALHRRQVLGSIRWAHAQVREGWRTFLIGDCNATPDSPQLAPWRRQPGWVVEGRGSLGGPGKDRRAVDLLVACNRSTRIRGATALSTAHSDHRPVIYDVATTS